MNQMEEAYNEYTSNNKIVFSLNIKHVMNKAGE